MLVVGNYNSTFSTPVSSAYGNSKLNNNKNIVNPQVAKAMTNEGSIFSLLKDKSQNGSTIDFYA